MLVYRVRPNAEKSRPLGALLKDVTTIDLREASFSTITEWGDEGICDIWLGRI
jgi:hypothetical protein